VLSNESQRILPIQVFISRSTPQTHPELWVIESLTYPLLAWLFLQCEGLALADYSRDFRQAKRGSTPFCKAIAV
jgi:hypothetical protein